MSGEQNRKGRIRLELKIQKKEEQNLIRQTSYRSKTTSKMTGSYCLERPIKGKSNPEDPYTSIRIPAKPLNKISNVVFTLPELVPSLDTEFGESTQLQEGRAESYYSAKIGQLRAQKDLSSRYYKQLQQLKSLKDPIVTQKVFTIMNLKNDGLEGARTDRGSNPKVKRLNFPPSAIDRYHIGRDREEKVVPLELKAKKYIRGLSQQAKTSLRTKLELGIKPRKVSQSKQHNHGFKLSGWQSDTPLYEL